MRGDGAPLTATPRSRGMSLRHPDGPQAKRTEREVHMSLARVQNFAISLDGFGTGEGQSHDAQFGHAGDRLHQWMFATRWWARGRHPAVAAASTTLSPGSSARGSAPRSWVREVRPPRMARGPGVEGRVGSQPAVPHTGLRPHPSPAPVHRDGGRHDVSLHRRVA